MNKMTYMTEGNQVIPLKNQMKLFIGEYIIDFDKTWHVFLKISGISGIDANEIMEAAQKNGQWIFDEKALLSEKQQIEVDLQLNLAKFASESMRLIALRNSTNCKFPTTSEESLKIIKKIANAI